MPVPPACVAGDPLSIISACAGSRPIVLAFLLVPFVPDVTP
jgi:hypothetical protein